MLEGGNRGGRGAAEEEGDEDCCAEAEDEPPRCAHLQRQQKKMTDDNDDHECWVYDQFISLVKLFLFIYLLNSLELPTRLLEAAKSMSMYEHNARRDAHIMSSPSLSIFFP